MKTSWTSADFERTPEDAFAFAQKLGGNCGREFLFQRAVDAQKPGTSVDHSRDRLVHAYDAWQKIKSNHEV